MHVSSPLPKASRFILSVCFFWVFYAQPALSDDQEVLIKQTMAALLASKQLPMLSQPDFSQQSQDMIALYRLNNNKLLWLGKGRSATDFKLAFDLLRNASADGLNPINYDDEKLRRYFQAVVSSRQNDARFLASCDLGLSVSLLRYLHDLHFGRIDPLSLNYPVQFGAKPALNAGRLLKRHLDQHSLRQLPEAAAPKIKQYSLLKQALSELRQQKDHTANLAKLSFSKSLHPGEQDPQLPLLRQHLLNQGEMTQKELVKANAAKLFYDDITKAAMVRLQQRQNMQADGIVGKKTQALLNQTKAEKINLIELAMEKLRWLPDQPDGPQIIVNIPAYQLWAINAPDDAHPLNMKVVVGKAQANQTPLLAHAMRYLEFMPYWNIPKSIMDKEILPKMRSENAPAYLSRLNIELIDKKANFYSEDPEAITDSIKNDRVRARQLPGNKNPLGKVKFIFPNTHDVYLHDSPFRWAFSQDRRDFSHGCVRVENAQKLVEFVLSHQQQGWDKKNIEQAMANPNTQRVYLTNSIPVLFLYNTVYVGQDKKLQFYPDIYGYDAPLQEAFKKQSL
jgi:murein L,D-transpeptidase YcbB/YkuD